MELICYDIIFFVFCDLSFFHSIIISLTISDLISREKSLKFKLKSRFFVVNLKMLFLTLVYACSKISSFSPLIAESESCLFSVDFILRRSLPDFFSGVGFLVSVGTKGLKLLSQFMRAASDFI